MGALYFYFSNIYGTVNISFPNHRLLSLNAVGLLSSLEQRSQPSEKADTFRNLSVYHANTKRSLLQKEVQELKYIPTLLTNKISYHICL
jgi:hypothetical protein